MKKKSKANIENKKKRRKTASILSLVVTVVMAFVFYFIFSHLNNIFGQILPAKYFDILKNILIGLVIFSAIITFVPIPAFLKVFVSIINILVIVALFFVSTIAPEYLGEAKKIFTEIPKTSSEKIVVYVEDDTYKELSDLAGKKLAIQNSFDLDNQDYALKIIRNEMYSYESILEIDFDDYYSAVDSMINHEMDAILLSKTYYEILSDNEDYQEYLSKLKELYTCSFEVEVNFDENKVGNITTEPFIISITGNDSRTAKDGLDYDFPRRSDVNMLLAVNPVTKKVAIITIPRDARVTLYSRDGSAPLGTDKLTHSSNYGMLAYTRTVEHFFGVKINYFARVNFVLFEKIIDAIGGVDVNNPYYFSDLGSYGQYKSYRYEFPEGEIHLNGEEALMYCRVRHFVHNGKEIGDEGRNMHQGLIIQSIINKATSLEFLSNITNIIQAISGSVITDFTYDEIMALVQMELNDLAKWDIETYNIPVKSDGYYPSYANGYNIELYMVNILDENLTAVKNLINNVMNINK